MRPSATYVPTTDLSSSAPSHEHAVGIGAVGQTRTRRSHERLVAGCWLLALPLFLVAAASWGNALSASSLVASMGLGSLAASDVSRRQLPRGTVRLVSLAVMSALLATSVIDNDWGPARRAGLAAMVSTAVVGALWCSMPDYFAFGDVKVTVIATAAAAASSWTAVVVMIVAAVLMGCVHALTVRVRRSRSPSPPVGQRAGVPFVPGLALGFALGVALW